MKRLWVECLWLSYDVRGLEVVLAPAFPLSGGQVDFEEGAKDRGRVYICQVSVLEADTFPAVPGSCGLERQPAAVRSPAASGAGRTGFTVHLCLSEGFSSLDSASPRSPPLRWDFSRSTWHSPDSLLHRSVSSRCVGTTSLNSMGPENFLEPD